ncbi:hypothetical protein RclHR1_07440011 [Rhizophagus clarus]|uniref:Myb-like domain-containing protein n=1 Tax=Rhizophagus clarus TaxID=94130 RepID=A0A2Z6RWT0_9GLOM|nr:hypothetical protein RclHR1_07440011 [Rhizophagus clarus]
MWNDPKIRLLIQERRNRNKEYWNIAGCSKVSFWMSVAVKINSNFRSTYTAEQCKEKFQNLVKENKLMRAYVKKKRNEKLSKSGEKYFDENFVSIDTTSTTITTTAIPTTTTITTAILAILTTTTI